jgi:HlyD family secretion protein
MLALLRVVTALVIVTLVPGCRESDNPAYQGWVEDDLVFVSPDEFGRIVRLDVREGDEIKAGAAICALDDDLQRATLNQNRATLAIAKENYDRAVVLSKKGADTQAALDAAQSALRVAEAQVNTSETRLARRRLYAPVTGMVEKIYFREGETVPPLNHVISIMPQRRNLRVRFFVPGRELPDLQIGKVVNLTCDTCPSNLTAAIYFVASQAEYAPPVIYSDDTSPEPVYLVQARPKGRQGLHIGQPVSVYFRRPKSN